MDVAVKANGVSCMNTTAIDNERRLLERLLQHPHRNILVVYGIVTDAPDGNVRLVMAYCHGGSLDNYLNAVRESGEVGNPALASVVELVSTRVPSLRCFGFPWR